MIRQHWLCSIAQCCLDSNTWQGIWNATLPRTLPCLRLPHFQTLYFAHLVWLTACTGKRRYDRKQSGYGGQTKPVFHKKVRPTLRLLTFCTTGRKTCWLADALAVL